MLTASFAAKNANSAKKSFIMVFHFAHFCELCGRKIFFLCASAVKTSLWVLVSEQ
jgi:hypothetical protein